MNPKISYIPKAVLYVLLLFLSFKGFSQLPAFTVSAVAVPETCPGNGALSFTVSGINPAANIDYAVYLTPSTTPVAVVTTPSVNGLVAGTYLVVATQSLSAESNTSSVTIVVDDQKSPLDFTIVQTPSCTNDGIITVNVTSGTAVSYEIIAGPLTKPIQVSNVFNNLPVGQYQVRLIDTCGGVYVVTYQVTAMAAGLAINTVVFDTFQLPSCNTISVMHEFLSSGGNTAILFPLTFEFTVFPPGGGTPSVVTQTVASGSQTDINQIHVTLPFYHDQQYSYNVEVTDACGNVFTRNNNSINLEFRSFFSFTNPGCDDFSLLIIPQYFVPPYTINFEDSPVGFVPQDFNASHPVFSTLSAVYGGEDNPVPQGDYTVEITDACGNTVTKALEISNTSPPAHSESTNPSTCLGEVSITLSGRAFDSVSITDAPDDYIGTLPDDVSGNITDLGFVMGDLPIGDYVFEVTDACGVIFTLPIEIMPASAEFTVDRFQRPGCETGMGSLRLRIIGAIIAGVTITATDAEDFNETLPYDVSFNLDDSGQFYMNSLPEGNYVFEVANNCGSVKTESITIEGYHAASTNVEIVPGCSSFSINLQHSSNGTYVQSFWLQKYDSVTGTWGHPQTGTGYTEGTFPTASNSVLLINNGITPSLTYSGEFRILKAFHVFSNGSSANTLCTSVLEEFAFEFEVSIAGAYGFPCVSGGSQVIVDAQGIAPLNYAIVDSLGNIVIDNGTSNVFTGLASGVYTIMVSDQCGNSQPYTVDINDLVPLAIAGTNLCEGEDGELSVTNFSFLTYEWWEQGDPDTILSTASILELSPFDSGLHAGTYNVRVTSAMGGGCGDQILEYVVQPNNIANAGLDSQHEFCNGGQVINLENYLSNPHDAGGVWTDITETGALTGSSLATTGLNAGTYDFSYTVTDMCGTTDTAVITLILHDIPAAPVLDLIAPVCEGENIQLLANAITDAVYQWTGPAGFTSDVQNPLITNAGLETAGTYQLIIVVNGCSSPPSTVNVQVNVLPDFTLAGSTSLCAGQSGVLHVVPNNTEASYEWYYDGVLQEGVIAPDIEIFQTGIYKVVVTLNGCSDEQQVVVHDNTNAFTVDLKQGCEDFEYVLSVINESEFPDASYSWTGPDGFTASGPQITITGAPSGEYVAEVTNAQGCMATAILNVVNTNCMIPKGISPGDATFNNSFDLSNMQVQHLSVFNRYGIKVYEKENYVNEWYGQSVNGNDLPTGTYYYEIELVEGKRLTGWVYIQRVN